MDSNTYNSFFGKGVGRALPLLLTVWALPAFAGSGTTSPAPITQPITDAPPMTPAGTQVNTAVALSYTAPDDPTTLSANSNPVSFVVGQVAGATLTPGTTSLSTTAGTKVYYPLSLVNAGNGGDKFALAVTAPAGWTAALVGDDKATSLSTPLSLTAQQTQKAFLVLTPPAKMTQQATVSTTVQMTSQYDATQTGKATLSTTCAASSPNGAPVVVNPVSQPPAAPALTAAWTVPTQGPVLGGAAILNGVAYVGSDDGSLYAIAATAGTATGVPAGTLLWKLATGAAVRAKPAVYKTPDGKTLVTVGNERGKLVTADAATGQMLWSRPLATWQVLPLRAQPLVSPKGDLVTVGLGDGYLYSFATTSGQQVRRDPWLRTTVVGDPAVGPDGHAWMMTLMGAASEVVAGVPQASRQVALNTLTASSLLLDPLTSSLFAVSLDGRVVAYNTTTLQASPTWTTATKVQATTPSRALTADGLYADAIAAAPTTEEPAAGPAEENGTAVTPMAALSVAAMPTNGVKLNAPVVATPALDSPGGLLYVGTSGHAVYAIKTADGTLRGNGWPFVAPGTGGFTASPLVWGLATATAPLLCVGDTAGVFYVVPTDQPGQPLFFATSPTGTGPTAPGEFDAPPAATGTSASDVVVVGNTNGQVYGFTLK